MKHHRSDSEKHQKERERERDGQPSALSRSPMLRIDVFGTSIEIPHNLVFFVFFLSEAIIYAHTNAHMGDTIKKKITTPILISYFFVCVNSSHSQC